MTLGLAGWSLQRHFNAKENPIYLLDYPQLARDEWGFEAVELNNIFMASHENDYVDELKHRAQEAGVALWGMAVDIWPTDGSKWSLCGDDEAERQKYIGQCVDYLQIGQRLGLDYMRFNTGGDVEPSAIQIETCIASFKQLAQEGEKLGVKVCIENHGGLSRFADPIVRVMQGVDSPWCRTLPDWGNFPADVRLESIDKVIPYAVACHAKFWSFDGQGRDPQQPVEDIRKICQRHGFDGRLAIEFEGEGDAFAGVHSAKALLSKTFA